MKYGVRCTNKFKNSDKKERAKVFTGKWIELINQRQNSIAKPEKK